MKKLSLLIVLLLVIFDTAFARDTSPQTMQQLVTTLMSEFGDTTRLSIDYMPCRYPKNQVKVEVARQIEARFFSQLTDNHYVHVSEDLLYYTRYRESNEQQYLNQLSGEIRDRIRLKKTNAFLNCEIKPLKATLWLNSYFFSAILMVKDQGTVFVNNYSSSPINTYLEELTDTLVNKFPDNGRDLIVDYTPCVDENGDVTDLTWQITQQFLAYLSQRLQISSVNHRMKDAIRKNSTLNHYLAQLYVIQRSIVDQNNANALLKCSVSPSRMGESVPFTYMSARIISEKYGTKGVNTTWSSFYE